MGNRCKQDDVTNLGSLCEKSYQKVWVAFLYPSQCLLAHDATRPWAARNVPLLVAYLVPVFKFSKRYQERTRRQQNLYGLEHNNIVSGLQAIALRSCYTTEKPLPELPLELPLHRQP